MQHLKAIDLKTLSLKPEQEDLENLFTVHVDKKGNYVYNLNRGLQFQINDDADLQTYVVTHPMHWPLASYQIYQTTRLAWLLMMLNGVDAKSMFKKWQPGDIVKYLSANSVTSLLATIADA